MNAEIWTIIATGIGLGAGLAAIGSLIYTMIRNFRADFDKKHDDMQKRWIETNARMDGVYHILLMRLKETEK